MLRHQVYLQRCFISGRTHGTTLQTTVMVWEYWHVASETTLSSEWSHAASHAYNKQYGMKTLHYMTTDF